eukprot:9504013-Pyramimonas_sp.AAC.1
MQFRWQAVHLPAPKVGQGIEVRCAPLWQRVRQRRTFGHSWIARSPLLLGQRNRSRQGGRYLLRPCLRQAARVAFRRILSLSATVADHYSCSEAAYLWSSRQWSSRSTVNMFAAASGMLSAPLPSLAHQEDTNQCCRLVNDGLLGEPYTFWGWYGIKEGTGVQFVGFFGRVELLNSGRFKGRRIQGRDHLHGTSFWFYWYHIVPVSASYSFSAGCAMQSCVQVPAFKYSAAQHYITALITAHT